MSLTVEQKRQIENYARDVLKLKDDLGLSETCHELGKFFDFVYKDRTLAVKKRRHICGTLCTQADKDFVNDPNNNTHTQYATCHLNNPEHLKS